MHLLSYFTASYFDLFTEDYYQDGMSSTDFKSWMAVVVLIASLVVPLIGWVTKGCKRESIKGFIILTVVLFVLMLQVIVIYASFNQNIFTPVFIMTGFAMYLVIRNNATAENKKSSNHHQKKGIMPDLIHQTIKPINKIQLPNYLLDFSQINAGGILETRFGIILNFIPPGKYNMGSPINERGRRSNENQVLVTITKGYWIAHTPCTQKQWQDIMGYNPSTFKGLDLPVHQVSWEDAKLFCKRLTEEGRRDGDLTEAMRWDLPSEAQWEYACRAESTTSLYNGKTLSSEDGTCTYLEKVAWYRGNSGGMPHPVAKLQPNKWGLYDMHGNVWEWCRDWYTDFNPGGEDPLNLEISNYRSIRGGGWGDDPWGCRSAARHQNPLPKDSDFGFRPIICLAES